VQWGIAYAASAWALLEVLGFAADAFAWPAVIKPLAMLGLVLGLPVVVTLAWYHGERDQQRVTGQELAILTVLLLIGGSVLWWYADRRTDTPVAAATSAPTPSLATGGRPSIAVLPFDNRSKLEDDAFFVDGIHDDILTQLSKVSALKVISRTSVERFRDTKLPLKDIAQQLGVDSILEGGVQRAGDRVRIHVQLIDAASDGHLWAESYDRELTAVNIFAIQSEVASAISGALKAALTPAEQARVAAIPTRNLQAWESYQLGKQRMAKRTGPSLIDAVEFFQKAIDLDPEFALAYADLAGSLILRRNLSDMPWDDATVVKAETAVAKALELDPKLAEAWASSGLIAMNSDQPDRAETVLRTAIDLNPNYATAHHWFSQVLAGRGRLDEALGHAEKAAALDPLSAIINLNLAGALEWDGRFAEAETRYRRAVAIDPAMPFGYGAIGSRYAYSLNRFADAVPFLKKASDLDPGNVAFLFGVATVRFDLGEVSEAIRLTQAAQQRWPDDFFVNQESAFVYAAQGDLEAAVRFARKSREVEPKNPAALSLLDVADLKKGDARMARSRWAQAYPELLAPEPPEIHASNYDIAVKLVPILQQTGESERATLLLDRSEQVIRTRPRLGAGGYGTADVAIHALRGDRAKALAALREAEKVGWRGPLWRYARDVEPALDSIRNEPEFKAIFADIERDMARQRAELAKRPKDAPLELEAAGP
jgi:TolB-like protein/Flp pilus assembly protein TadD